MIGNKSKTGKGQLSDDQVREIRKRLDLWKQNSPIYISEQTGVSVHIIRSILQDRAYTHVLDEGKGA